MTSAASSTEVQVVATGRPLTASPDAGDCSFFAEMKSDLKAEIRIDQLSGDVDNRYRLNMLNPVESRGEQLPRAAL